MAVTTHIPAMKPGSLLRNMIVAAVYLVLFPFTLLFAPFWILYAVGRNRYGLGNRVADSVLTRLPGVSTAGWKSGLALFLYAFLGAMILLAVIGGATSSPDSATPAADRATTTIVNGVTPTATGVVDSRTPTATTTATTTTTRTPPTETQSQPPSATKTRTSTATTDQSTTTTTAATGQQTEWQVTVTRIVDGDTLEVKFPDGHTENVRLLGVDTPEVHTKNDPTEFEGIPDNGAGRDWLRDWGHKASEFARTELLDTEITIETDPDADRRGGFGRLLVYAYSDDTLFNRVLLKQGYARMFDSSFSKRDEFASLEAHAQAENIGLWSFESTTTTATATTTTSSDSGTIGVAEIHADAEGNDHENKNDEYIVFENTGDASLDLTGWQVSDEADHTYTFPDGFSLDAGSQVTLHTGSGEDTETDLYWGSDSAIWNNGGDTIIVTDENGNEVLRKTYDG